MKATIQSYDAKSGEGKILAGGDYIYPFDKSAWLNVNRIPEIGLEVDIEVDENGHVTSMRPLQPPLQNQPESEAAPESPPEEAPSETPASPEADLLEQVLASPKSAPAKTPSKSAEERVESFGTEQKKSENDSDSDQKKPLKIPDVTDDIEMSASIDSCVNDYFSDAETLIASYTDTIDSDDKEMEFLKMKRFLFTAYNNLTELDSQFADQKLIKLQRELLGLQKQYELFAHKIKYPIEYAYEKVFLSKQTTYQKGIQSLEYLRSQVQTFSTREKPLLEKIREKEQQLAAMGKDKKSKAYINSERVLKSLRKRYVDLLTYVSRLRDNAKKLSENLDEFKREHHGTFIDQYEPTSRSLDSRIQQILNKKAYEFDGVLWERAKKCKAIRQFFMDSGIEGTYSSKTFLKYYINSLDESKMSQEHKSLLELLKYLETIGSKTVLIVRSNIDQAMRCKFLIESIDKEIRVITSYDPADTFRTCARNSPDIVMLDMNLRTMTASEYIPRFRKQCLQEGDKDPLLCLFLSDTSERTIKEAIKMGVKSVVKPNLTDEEFTDFLRGIL